MKPKKSHLDTPAPAGALSGGGDLKERLEKVLNHWLANASLSDLGDPIDAILSELDAAGYAVVPREPTERICTAGFVALVGDQGGQTSAGEIWQAMIAAAEQEQDDG